MTTLTELAKGIKMSATMVDSNPNIHDGWASSAHHYRIVLRYGRRRMSTYFSQGPGICSDPQPEDVVECLLSDASVGDLTFQDFCIDLGYDEDSRRAYATWEVCRETSDRLRRLLGEDFIAFQTADRE